MSVVIVKAVFGIDCDNIDIIEPILNKDEAIEFVKITTKSNNSIKLTLEQYRELIADIIKF